jgi:cutinase
MGPAVCKLLRAEYKDRIGCDGLGPAYAGGLIDNFQPKGTTDAAIQEGVRVFTLAHTKCPKSVLVFAGFRFVLHLILMPKSKHVNCKQN